MRYPLTFVGIISELLLWGVLLIGVVWGWLAWEDYRNSQPARQTGGQTITLYFKDVSQLGPGSTVHFMGSDVGYVDQVRIRNGQVEVQVKTYPDAVRIPTGSRFTVEFNGLAGAKSLEALPPDSPESAGPNAPYIVENPTRLRDVFHTSSIMAKALQATSDNISLFLGNPEDLRAITLRLANINESLHIQTEHFQEAEKTLHGLSDEFHGRISQTLKVLQAIQNPIARFDRMSRSQTFRARAVANVYGLDNLFRQGNQAVRQVIASDEQVLQWQQRIRDFQASACQAVPPFLNGWQRFNVCLVSWDQSLMRMQQKTNSHSWSERLRRLQEESSQLRIKTRQLNAPTRK